MHQSLVAVCAALDELSSAIISGWSGDQTFQEAWGWNCLPLTRQEFAKLPKNLADRIRTVAPTELQPVGLEVISDIPRRLQLLRTNTLPQLYNGNSVSAAPVFLETLRWVETVLDPLLGWQRADEPELLPPALARRLKTYNTRLNRLDPDMDSLVGMVERIKAANDASAQLDTDLDSLNAAQQYVHRMVGEISAIHSQARTKEAETLQTIKSITDQENQAKKLVDGCEEAYRITTTKGLASAFDERAKSLKESMQWWVAGLFAALVAGGLLGAHRIEMLSAAISGHEPQWGAVLLQLVLSALSIGGPLWFAWLATKQVGQRFRLAEDYAFKASVAKAYEGYRKEAARIDELFEARLFSSALSRLEEAPLRLVEGTTHGSPWHEFMSSSAFQEAVSTVPEFKETLTEILKKGTEAVREKVSRPERKIDAASKSISNEATEESA